MENIAATHSPRLAVPQPQAQPAVGAQHYCHPAQRLMARPGRCASAGVAAYRLASSTSSFRFMKQALADAHRRRGEYTIRTYANAPFASPSGATYL